MVGKAERKALEWTKGNSKVPFRVVNLCAAADCPSRKLGMCQCPDKCYADKAERQYPQVLPFRRRQADFWKHASFAEIITAANKIEEESNRATSAMMKRKVLRFSEAGDFASQSQVARFALFAKTLIGLGWQVYGYTARIDLDLKALLKLGVKINLSRDCKRYANRTNRFRVVSVPSGNNFVCVGDCSKCGVCRSVSGKTIEVVVH